MGVLEPRFCARPVRLGCIALSLHRQRQIEMALAQMNEALGRRVRPRGEQSIRCIELVPRAGEISTSGECGAEIGTRCRFSPVRPGSFQERDRLREVLGTVLDPRALLFGAAEVVERDGLVQAVADLMEDGDRASEMRVRVFELRFLCGLEAELHREHGMSTLVAGALDDGGRLACITRERALVVLLTRLDTS